METRKWTFANVVLVRGLSYSVGPYRFVPGRPVKVTNPRVIESIRGNPAFSIEDHWNDEGTKGLAGAKAASVNAPKPAPAAPNPSTPEPERPPEDLPPPLAPAAGIPAAAFVITTESKPAGKKVLKKKTRVED